MVTLNAHFDGKTIVPDEPLALAPNQKLRITIETLDSAPAPGDRGSKSQHDKPKRVFGQQKDVVLYIAPDFDDYLGDEFWGLGDEKQE